MFDGQHLKRSANEDSILKYLCKFNSPLIMFHHRFPTSTINVKRAAHPMSTRDFFGETQYVLVHNGVIYNAKELYEQHQQLGIKYSTKLKDGTYNDSETLLWDIALTLQGVQEEPKARGRIAFIVMEKNGNDLVNMYFGRNHGSPLHLDHTTEHLALSSEGKGTEVQPNFLYQWEYATKKLTFSPMTFPQYDWKSSSYTAPTPSRTVYSDFDDYYEEKYGYKSQSFREKAGSWLGDTLQDKYQKLLDENAHHEAIEGEVIDEEAIEEEENMLLARYFSLQPDPGEVEAKALSYLSQYNGLFSEAYYALEVDYENNLGQSETDDVLHQRLVIEGAMEYIETDPEYTDEDALSSFFWGPLCKVA